MGGKAGAGLSPESAPAASLASRPVRSNPATRPSVGSPGPVAATAVLPGAYRRAGATMVAEPCQLVDDLVEPLALDELHGVIGRLAVLADLEDRHDVGVVQPRRRLRLAAEPLQRLGVVRDLVRQDLQRHPAAQADLLGLVDDPHAAPADLPEDPVVAQPLRPARDRIPRGRRRVAVVVDREVLLDHHQGRQQPADLVGQLGVAGGVLGDAGTLAGPVSRQERFGNALEGIAIESRTRSWPGP